MLDVEGVIQAVAVMKSELSGKVSYVIELVWIWSEVTVTSLLEIECTIVYYFQCLYWTISIYSNLQPTCFEVDYLVVVLSGSLLIFCYAVSSNIELVHCSLTVVSEFYLCLFLYKLLTIIYLCAVGFSISLVGEKLLGWQYSISLTW